ncbi:unnamed protein product [Lymnaea stagnalis]|uniref:Uncharacterized protein n=1 Tax=Lymnaea stagnalis TaxID=6523 RepID=A0AAV2H245_LYMST
MDLKVAVILALACCATSSAETCSEGLLRCQNSFTQSTGDMASSSTYYYCVAGVVCDMGTVEYTQQQTTLALLQKELGYRKLPWPTDDDHQGFSIGRPSLVYIVEQCINVDSKDGGYNSAPLTTTTTTTSFTVMAVSLLVRKMMITGEWN